MTDAVKVCINVMEDSKNKIVEGRDVIDECLSLMNLANGKLGEFSNNLSSEINEVNEVKKILDSMINYYDYAISSYQFMYNENVDLVFNSIFDANDFNYFSESVYSEEDRGRFGCNQGGAYSLYLAYIEDPDSFTSDLPIMMCQEIERLFNEKGIYDPNEILYCLDVARHTGCGYAALTNVVCDYYDNKENGNQEFEEKFGFPLYFEDEDGNKRYNFEGTFTYMVLLTTGIDNEVLPNQIAADNTDGYIDATISVDREEMKEFFYEIAGPNCEYASVDDVSVDTYERMMEYGYDYASIALHNFTLKPYGTNPRPSETVDGGHWMSIIGISENGNYIVSSWGYEWEIVGCTPKDADGLSFYKVGE